MEGQEKKNRWCNMNCIGNGSFWGWFFVVVGGYFLAQEIGIIPTDFPLWQILIILFGIYLIAKTNK
jgi:hypothetical protein